MNSLSERYLKTGDDPSMLPEYISLYDEMSKFTHSVPTGCGLAPGAKIVSDAV